MATSQVESGNDQLTEELSHKIGQLRHLSIEIGDEISLQNNRVLRDMDEMTSRTHASMLTTGNRVQRLMSHSSSAFSGCFFFLLVSVAVCSTFWLLLKTR